MDKRALGSYVTASVFIPDDDSDPVQTRQGILIGFDKYQHPIILSEAGTTYHAVSPEFVVVPDDNLYGDTLGFVDRWRSENLQAARSKATRMRNEILKSFLRGFFAGLFHPIRSLKEAPGDWKNVLTLAKHRWRQSKTESPMRRSRTPEGIDR